VVIPYRRFGTTYCCALRNSPEERSSRNMEKSQREGLRIPWCRELYSGVDVRMTHV